MIIPVDIDNLMICTISTYNISYTSGFGHIYVFLPFIYIPKEIDNCVMLTRISLMDIEIYKITGFENCKRLIYFDIGRNHYRHIVRFSMSLVELSSIKKC